jgi:hypothetical protein
MKEIQDDGIARTMDNKLSGPPEKTPPPASGGCLGIANHDVPKFR